VVFGKLAKPLYLPPARMFSSVLLKIGFYFSARRIRINAVQPRWGWLVNDDEFAALLTTE